MGRLRRTGAHLLLATALVGAMLVSAGPGVGDAAAVEADTVDAGDVRRPRRLFRRRSRPERDRRDRAGRGARGFDGGAGLPLRHVQRRRRRPSSPTAPSTSTARRVVLDFLANSEPGNSSLATARGDVTAQVATKVGSGGGITDFAVNTDPAPARRRRARRHLLEPGEPRGHGRGARRRVEASG